MTASKCENVGDTCRPCRIIRIECNESETHAKSLDDSLMILRFILHQRFEDLISKFNDMDILTRQTLIAFIKFLI